MQQHNRHTHFHSRAIYKRARDNKTNKQTFNYISNTFDKYSENNGTNTHLAIFILSPVLSVHGSCVNLFGSSHLMGFGLVCFAFGLLAHSFVLSFVCSFISIRLIFNFSKRNCCRIHFNSAHVCTTNRCKWMNQLYWVLFCTNYISVSRNSAHLLTWFILFSVSLSLFHSHSVRCVLSELNFWYIYSLCLLPICSPTLSVLNSDTAKMD